MEDKQLNFNQPLLSVRRFSSTAITSEADNKKKIDKPIPKLPPLPFYKSELKSGPIRNPGTVPFVWEKTPGKPKDERKSHPRFPQQPHIAPRLPPGRVSNINHDTSDKVSSNTTSTQTVTIGVVPSSYSKAVSESDKTNTTEDMHNKQEKEDRSSTRSENGGDETYMDALDTLSRSESYSMTCSVSGTSGVDGPDMKLSGTFVSDPSTRDFMMGRFLPAAKAMASETPQYAQKKQSALWDQPRHVNMVAYGNRQCLSNQYQSNDLPPYAQELRARETDNESDIYEESDVMSAKVCGLFPRFLRSSACLLNPVPGMKLNAQFPASSVRRVYANSSSTSSCGERKIVHVEDIVCVPASVCRQQKGQFGKSDTELNCNTARVGEKNGSPKLDHPSMKKHLQGNGSAHHSKFSQFKLSEPEDILGLPEKVMSTRQSELEAQNSKRRIFQELLAIENADWEFGPEIPAVEKTLYIDSVHTMKSPGSSSSSSDMKSLTDCKGNNAEDPEKGSSIEESHSLHSLPQDIKCMSVSTKKKATRPNSLESVDSCSLSSSETKIVSRQDTTDLNQNPRSSENSKEADEENLDLESHWSGKSHDTEKFHDLGNESIMSTCSKISDTENKTDLVTLKTEKFGTESSSNTRTEISTPNLTSNGQFDLESHRFSKLGTEVTSQENFLQMTLTLPSPKSPSESWLKRALPVATSRSSRSSLAARIGISSPVTSPLDPKWENIVKTSNIHQGRLRFPEEHLAPIPEA